MSAVVYDSYVSAQKPRVYGSLHCCERKVWNLCSFWLANLIRTSYKHFVKTNATFCGA